MTIKDPTKGLVRLADTTTSLSTMQSLAQNDAILIETTYATQGRGFLLKRYRMIGDMELAPLRLNAIVAVALAGATAAEAESTLEANLQTGNQFSSFAAYMAQLAISWNSIFQIGAPAGHVDNNDISWDTNWMDVGAKGKGIPMKEGFGPALVLYNLGAAFPADVEMNFLTIYEGVYLSD